MALQNVFMTPQGIALPTSYIRIDEQSGDKNRINLRVHYYADQQKCEDGCEWLAEVVVGFTPSVDDDAPNFIKQGYEYMKTLPDFATAVDC